MLTKDRFRRLALPAACLSAFVVPLIVIVPHWGNRDYPIHPPTASSSTTLKVDQAEWDFGVVGSEVNALTHVFTIHNHGSSPIQLRVAKLGCSCLGVECPTVISPDSSVPITVKVEIRSRQGAFATLVRIDTSDSSVPELDLVLRFYAHPDMQLDPPFLQFTDVPRGTVLERTFRVFLSSDSNTSAHAPPQVTVSSPAIQCEQQKTETEIRRTGRLFRATYSYHLRLATGDLPPGDNICLSQGVRLQPTGSPKLAGIDVPIEVSLRHHRWLVGPTTLTLRRNGPEKRVQLRSRDGKDFTVTKVVSSVVGVECSFPDKILAPLQEGVVRSILRPRSSSDGIQSGFIEVSVAPSPQEPYRLEVLLLP